MEPFQDDIKYLHKEDYESLRSAMLSEGYSEPIGVWEHKGKNHIISGHQRHFALGKMREEGIKVPEVPVSLIQCKNKKEAKKKVLELASVYGRFKEDKLLEYVEANGLDLAQIQVDIRLPQIDLTSLIQQQEEFEEDPFDLSDIEDQKISNGNMKTHSSHVKMLQLFFNDKSHGEVLEMCNKLSEYYGNENVTDTIDKCVKECYAKHCS